MAVLREAEVWILSLVALFVPDHLQGQQFKLHGGHSSVLFPSLSPDNSVYHQDDYQTVQSKYNPQLDFTLFRSPARHPTSPHSDGGEGWPYRHRRFDFHYTDFRFRPKFPVGLVDTIGSYLQQVPLAEQENSTDSTRIPSQRLFLNSGL